MVPWRDAVLLFVRNSRHFRDCLIGFAQKGGDFEEYEDGDEFQCRWAVVAVDVDAYCGKDFITVEDSNYLS